MIRANLPRTSLVQNFRRHFTPSLGYDTRFPDFDQLSATAAKRSRVVLSLIGNTPLVRLHFHPEDVAIYAKCEFLNPSGSIKDRLAKCLILDAERRGLLKPGSVILECTSQRRRPRAHHRTGNP